MTTKQGNHYTLEILDNGVVSFRHTQTGEILHGSVGPEREAKELYIKASGLTSWNSCTAVVFDVGMGCAAQLLALLDFLESSTSIETLVVYSFDLEKHGLRAALEAREQFPSVERHHLFLEEAIKKDGFAWTTTLGKRLKWNFVAGDFRQSLDLLLTNSPTVKADFIFYDFFSPASHPWLWTYELFKLLRKASNDNTRLVTYSSATCVKAALGAAGWFVGTTIASGKKASSIIAGSRIELLANPLPAKFLLTFQSSHKPFCDSESEATRQEIREKISSHPQFGPNGIRNHK